MMPSPRSSVLVLIGIPILIALWLLNTVLVIIASVKAGQGEFYRYPVYDSVDQLTPRRHPERSRAIPSRCF